MQLSLKKSFKSQRTLNQTILGYFRLCTFIETNTSVTLTCRKRSLSIGRQWFMSCAFILKLNDIRCEVIDLFVLSRDILLWLILIPNIKSIGVIRSFLIRNKLLVSKNSRPNKKRAHDEPPMQKPRAKKKLKITSSGNIKFQNLANACRLL